MVQKAFVVQQVLVQSEPRTEEEALGKAQSATRHSHLEFPGTWASAKKKLNNINRHITFDRAEKTWWGNREITIVLQFCTLSEASIEPSSSPPPNFHFPPERQHWSPFSAAWITCTEERRKDLGYLRLCVVFPIEIFIKSTPIIRTKE